MISASMRCTRLVDLALADWTLGQRHPQLLAQLRGVEILAAGRPS